MSAGNLEETGQYACYVLATGGVSGGFIPGLGVRPDLNKKSLFPHL